MFVANLRQLVPIDFPLLATTVALNFGGGLLLFGRLFFVARHRRIQLKQMTLSFTFGETLSPPTERPTFVPSQFVQRSSMLLLQFFVRSSCLIQYAVKFCHLLFRFRSPLFQLHGLLEGCQQEPVAFREIVG